MIHQAVFGYENGHQLLESSLVELKYGTLVKKKNYKLLTFLLWKSDRQDDIVRRKGYPYPQTFTYGGWEVYSQTWYDGSQRLGTVWTHQLLFSPDRKWKLGEIATT